MNWVRCEYHIGGFWYFFTEGMGGKDGGIGCQHPARWITFCEIYDEGPIFLCGVHLKFLRQQGLAERWRAIPELREDQRKQWPQYLPVPKQVSWQTDWATRPTD